MVDRVYKGGVPELRKSIERLRGEFSKLRTPTDWVRLRVDPLRKHARELERLLTSPKFSGEFSRLKKGVALFHSDLVYLRTNVRELQRILENEKKRKTS